MMRSGLDLRKKSILLGRLKEIMFTLRVLLVCLYLILRRLRYFHVLFLEECQ